MATLWLAMQGNILFGSWISWNGSKGGYSRKFQVMDSIIHTEHIVREVIAEKRALPDSSRKLERMVLSLVNLNSTGQMRAGHMTIQPFVSHRALVIRDTEYLMQVLLPQC